MLLNCETNRKCLFLKYDTKKSCCHGNDQNSLLKVNWRRASWNVWRPWQLKVDGRLWNYNFRTFSVQRSLVRTSVNIHFFVCRRFAGFKRRNVLWTLELSATRRRKISDRSEFKICIMFDCLPFPSSVLLWAFIDAGMCEVQKYQFPSIFCPAWRYSDNGSLSYLKNAPAFFDQSSERSEGKFYCWNQVSN